MKTSVSSYSFRQYIRAGKLTQLECVSKAKEMGFDGIEFTDLAAEGLEAQKELAKQIRAEAERVGIEIVAYTIGAKLYRETEEECEAEIERLKGQIEVASLLGAKVMRHDVCSSLTKTGNGRSFDLMLPTMAKNARKVAEYAETLGVKTCSENHGRIAQDSERIERLFNAVAHDNYGVLIDLGNFLCVDENPAYAVSRLAPYAVHVHAKDFTFSTEPGSGRGLVTRGANYLGGCVIGEGVVPIKKCLSILKFAGYDGYVSVEYEGTEDCMSGIARGLANLKSYIDAL